MKSQDLSSFQDKDLVQLVISDPESDAFSILYDRYQDKVRNKCFSLVKSNSESDDLCQDIFLKAMENLTKFRGDSSFSTWLYSITYNHCIQHLRNSSKLQFGDSISNGWEEEVEIEEEEDEEEVEFLLQQKSDRLETLLDLVKPEEKALLLMKYKEGMSLKMMQEALNAPSEAAVKMKLNRVKKRLISLSNKLPKKP